MIFKINKNLQYLEWKEEEEQKKRQRSSRHSSISNESFVLYWRGAVRNDADVVIILVVIIGCWTGWINCSGFDDWIIVIGDDIEVSWNWVVKLPVKSSLPVPILKEYI